MDKWSMYDNMNLSTLPCHYVSIRDAIVTRVSGECDQSVYTLRVGMLVEAKEIKSDGGLRISVKDTNNHEVWHKTEWKCHRIDFVPVSEKVWYFLAAVSIPQERVRLAQDTKFCEDVDNLKINYKVWYYPEPNSAKRYKAVIKLIGPVEDLGPGFYFGLELLDKPDSIRTSLVAKKHFAGSSNNSTFATLVNIQPMKSDEVNFTPFSANAKLSQKEIEASWSKQLDGFVNSTTNNHAVNGKYTQHDLNAVTKKQFIHFEDKNNNNNSSNNNDTKRESDSSRLNESLVPKVVHQSAKSKVLSNHDGINLSKSINNYNFIPIDDLFENYDNNKMIRKDNGKSLDLGTEVEILVGSELRHGVIRWIDSSPGSNTSKIMAAIEFKDDPHLQGTDGAYSEVKHLNRKLNRSMCTDTKSCQQSNVTPTDDSLLRVNDDNLSKTENLVIKGIIRPICVEEGLENICGKYRGIQGHHNSCYLDATLFSMFAFTSVFDNLLFRPPTEKDCAQYEEVQRVLREEIVNPLRKNIFVHANRVMKLRTLLEELSSVSGLTSEEKDPEEFLTSLVAQILNAEPFLKLSSGQDAYHYQLFVEKDDHLNLPTVQQLLEQSFLTSNIRLKEVPSCLIIQMPRFGKSFKMYSKIQPTLLLDVTDIIEDSPRQCTVCGKLAEYECKECYGQRGLGLESIAFCTSCLDQVHRHERRTNHESKKLVVPTEFTILQEHCPVPRLFLELSAVVCIETSHYVSFVKCGSGSEAPWCFFDSMADREGEQNGFNIPEMVSCPDFPYWLSEEGAKYLAESTDDRQLPEYAKRLLCDAYMCMYQSSDVMMYK
ncbi:ubiquitin carboxyl-terminal hydrolase CYLD isoform X1 [Microplitis demolitor]|uniref:ubiquitin carboxyl-terminal hydrolase CYLD isoform X1 n=1 Tax=Microplitis demolitor TaxID=69319 RepID=UPI0006D518D8|nr:ubiquitin carboxyl-terminal hydrolase CYLD isoform X1 [Microplitis demolitor]XP_014298450.1 ubiquitin carboxyl-terminal hydrolase CYLD isoform X1 [Microplitis demolitor]